MERRVLQPGEWVLIASGMLMLVGVGAIYITNDFQFMLWLSAKMLYGAGVIVVVYKLFLGTKR
ncbi:MAG: hypothetical protein WDZ79_01670 [Candidatus Paceibacterota bacterium]